MKGMYAMRDSRVGQLLTDADDALQVTIKWPDNTSSGPVAAYDLVLQTDEEWIQAVKKVRDLIRHMH